MSVISVSGTKLPTGPVDVITRSTVPIWRPSTISRSPPSALAGNCLIVHLPFVSRASSSPMAVAETP